jgi:hypothetical protein
LVEGNAGWEEAHVHSGCSPSTRHKLITTKSHAEMQRLKLYILPRDMMRKQRVTEEMDSQEHVPRQEVIPPMAKKKNVRPRGDDMEWIPMTPTSRASSDDKKIQLMPEEKAKLKAWLEGQ